MFDKTYRQRLEADLSQWEADGVIAPAAATSIRSALPPLSPGINIAVVVAIVGGLLIAAPSSPSSRRTGRRSHGCCGSRS